VPPELELDVLDVLEAALGAPFGDFAGAVLSAPCARSELLLEGSAGGELQATTLTRRQPAAPENNETERRVGSFIRGRRAPDVPAHHWPAFTGIPPVVIR
jgi:hypothetical protein